MELNAKYEDIETNPLLSNTDILEMLPNQVEIGANGSCTVQIRFTQLSMSHENRKFVVWIRPKLSVDTDIARVCTNEMLVVKHRLVFQEILPDLWYKDEGGREKCMVLPIHLIDENEEKVQNRAVGIKIVLVYENEQVVMKQEILKLSPDSHKAIDASGEAYVRFRIEDVSKNHQGQAFRVKVEADTAKSPLLFDVACDFSSVISVRSKRNKRARTKASRSNSTLQSGPYHTGMGSGGKGIGISEAAKRKVREAVASLSGSLDGRSVKAGSGTPGDAMAGVIRWAATVVNGLHSLEWQVIGHETKNDGTSDPSRPLYRCPSCWRYKDILTYHSAQHGSNCTIANILMQYATQTMSQLHVVLKAIEEPNTMITPMVDQSIYRTSPVTATNGANVATSRTVTSPPVLTRGITDMVNSMDIPSLLRGASSGLQDIMHGSDSSLHLEFRDPSSTSGSGSIEQRVFYVLALMQNTDVGGIMGFPAFDRNQQLLGYYQEGQDNATTEIMFFSLSAMQGRITQSDVAKTHSMLMNEAKNNHGAVFSLPKCSNDLTKLKEDALMYHWSHGSSSINSLPQMTW